MEENEPINLSEWITTTGTPQRGCLFTCGRPGRATFGTRRNLVGDETIDCWVKGLPEYEVLHIVSLLGEKKDGFSEFGYYPFRSSMEQGSKPTFQHWLDARYGRRFVVHEFPTTDARPIQSAHFNAILHEVLDLLENGNTVVVIDSAGAVRTASVCEAIGYKKKT